MAAWCSTTAPTRCFTTTTCARLTSAWWRPEAANEPGLAPPEPHLRPAGGRAVRPGRGGPVASIRGHAGAERRPWRAADARRLRQLLAVHARGHRSVHLPTDRRAAAVSGRYRAAPGPVSVPDALRRGDQDQRLVADRVRP